MANAKDITEKRLESYADVFADIVNVLLFNGERLMQPQDLLDTFTHSAYKGSDKKIHDEDRDVAKFWKNGNIHIAFIGLENQTDVDSDMVFRVIGYDGAIYRDQINHDKPKKPKVRFPVITLVLYFGYEHHWGKKISLSDCLKIPKELLPYFHDYKINLFEIAWLSDETISKFQSDFKFVADFFVQMRKNKNYQPSKWQLNHVAAFLDLMTVLTGDTRFSDSYTKNMEGGALDMNIPFLDEIENRGFDKGIVQGISQGISQGEILKAEKIALNMLADNEPLEKIRRFTELSVEKIKELAKNKLHSEKTTS